MKYKGWMQVRRCLVCDAIKKSFSMEYKNMCSDCEKIERERKGGKREGISKLSWLL